MPITVKFDPTANSIQAQILPDASLFNDGVMTKAQVAELGLSEEQLAQLGAQLAQLTAQTQAQAAQLARLQSTVDFTIFVSLSGDDANPGTAALPVKTLAGAYARLPATWTKSATIQFVDIGTYEFGPAVPVDGQLSGVQLGAVSSPLAILGQKSVQFTGTVTAGSATGVVFTDAGLALTPNAFEGAFIVVTSGASAGESFMIIENDATNLWINFPTSSPIAIGDTFQVYRPGVTINGPVTDFMVMAAQLGGITGYRDIKFAPQGPPMTFAHHRVVVLMGCEIDLTSSPVCIVGFGVQMHGFGFDSPWAARADNPFIDPSGFTGVYVHDGRLLCTDGSIQSLSVFVLRNAVLDSQQAILDDVSIDAKDSTVLVSANSTFSHTEDPNTPGRIIGAESSQPAGLIFQNSVGSLVDVLDISGSPGNAVQVLGSRVNLGLVTTGAAINSGTPNTGAGIAVDEASVAIIDAPDGSGSTTVTGTAGDSLFGHTTIPTTKTYVQLHTADVNGVEGFTDTYLNQIAPPPP